MPQLDGQRNHARGQIAIAAYLRLPLRLLGPGLQDPDDAVVDGADLDLVRTGIALGADFFLLALLGLHGLGLGVRAL